MLSLHAVRRQTPFWLSLARRELGPIVLVLLLAAFILVFRHIAEEVGEGDTRAFDRAIIYALRTPGDPHRPIGPGWLNNAALDFTALGSVTILTLFMALVCGLCLSLRHWREALFLLVAGGGGLFLTDLLKDVFQRDRPPAMLHATAAVGTSFPSGHATLSTTVFLTFGALIAHFSKRRRVRIYALSAAVILALGVGCTRVYLGVHWPTDVLAGWCVGSAWALIWWAVAIAWERLTHRSLVVVEPGPEAPPDEGLRC
jgi:undecaprenyl-diphosphatase